jgi:hypothetical protein
MFAKLMHILMMTLLGCKVMRIIQILLVLRAALDSSSLLQSVPCFDNQIANRDSSIHDGSQNHCSFCMLQRAVYHHQHGLFVG